MTSEIELKTSRLVGMMRQHRLAAILLVSQHNFSWLTGGSSNAIDVSRENGAAALLVTGEGRRFVLASNIEMHRMLTEQISEKDFEPISFSWQQEKRDPALVFDTALRLAGGSLGTDLSIDQRATLFEGSISRCRCRLLPEEQDRMRRLGADASEAFAEAVGKLTPGISEEAAGEALRASLGARKITSVVTLAAADARISKFRHPSPTSATWRKTLLLVTCAKRSGLIVSLSRMISAGPVPKELQQKTEAAAYVNASLWHAARPGVTGADLYRTAETAYVERGFPGEINDHHQGGAAGYRTREWVAHPESQETVNVDQAFAWNPSIAGTKVEETVLVNDGGFEVLTATANFPTIETVIAGRSYYSPGILTI